MGDNDSIRLDDGLHLGGLGGLDDAEGDTGGTLKGLEGFSGLAGGEGLSLAEGLNWFNENVKMIEEADHEEPPGGGVRTLPTTPFDAREERASAHLAGYFAPLATSPETGYQYFTNSLERRLQLHHREGPATSGGEISSAFPDPLTRSPIGTGPSFDPLNLRATSLPHAARTPNPTATKLHNIFGVLGSKTPKVESTPSTFPTLPVPAAAVPKDPSATAAPAANSTAASSTTANNASISAAVVPRAQPALAQPEGPFVLVVLNGITTLSIPLPTGTDAAAVTTDTHKLPPPDVFNTFRTGRAAPFRVQTVCVIPCVFVDQNDEWSVSCTMDAAQGADGTPLAANGGVGERVHAAHVGNISLKTPSITNTCDLPFIPGSFTVTIKQLSKVSDAGKDPAEAHIISIMKTLFHDAELNPRGGSMLISVLEDETLRLCEPDVWDRAIVQNRGGVFSRFIEAHPDVFLLFRCSDREIETRCLDKVSAREHRVALTLQEKRVFRPKLHNVDGDEELERELVQRIEDILSHRDYTQCELLDLLVQDPRFLFYLAPSFSTLMRFLGKHKDIFEWSTHPDKPTSIGLVGMLKKDGAGADAKKASPRTTNTSPTPTTTAKPGGKDAKKKDDKGKAGKKPQPQQPQQAPGAWQQQQQQAQQQAQQQLVQQQQLQQMRLAGGAQAGIGGLGVVADGTPPGAQSLQPAGNAWLQGAAAAAGLGGLGMNQGQSPQMQQHAMMQQQQAQGLLNFPAVLGQQQLNPAMAAAGAKQQGLPQPPPPMGAANMVQQAAAAQQVAQAQQHLMAAGMQAGMQGMQNVQGMMPIVPGMMNMVALPTWGINSQQTGLLAYAPQGAGATAGASPSTQGLAPNAGAATAGQLPQFVFPMGVQQPFQQPLQ